MRIAERSVQHTKVSQNTGNTFLASLIKGAVAGTIATLPMTAFMLLMMRALPRWQHYDLPPEKLTDELAKRADVKQHMNKPQKVALALVAHFGYGATMGMLYSLFMQKGTLRPFHFLLKGNVFGLAVWAINYLGLLPVLKMPSTAPKETPHRNLLMIGAHLVWGTTVGLTAHLFGGDS